MFAVPEQISVATKANLEAQLALITELTTKAFAGVEKFIDLNLTTAKASLEESTATAKQLLSAKDPKEFFSLTAAQSQPNTEKAIAYGRDLVSLATTTHAEFTKAAEAQITDTKQKVMSLIDEVTKNAPAGSENAIAIFKSAIGNANTSYEQLAKSTRQAAEVIESNLATAVNQFTQAAEKYTPYTTSK